MYCNAVQHEYMNHMRIINCNAGVSSVIVHWHAGSTHWRAVLYNHGHHESQLYLLAAIQTQPKKVHLQPNCRAKESDGDTTCAVVYGKSPEQCNLLTQTIGQFRTGSRQIYRKALSAFLILKYCSSKFLKVSSQ